MTDLEIALSGSDLSESMLESCKQKTLLQKQSVNLKCSDFRNLSCWGNDQFDCVASTGNSLPHVSNDDVMKALEEIKFCDDTRINIMQVWDYNLDGSMTFNILYTFEKENHIFQREMFQEHYYPISKKKIITKLKEMGCEDIEVKFFPTYFEFEDVELIEWHSIIARKK